MATTTGERLRWVKPIAALLVFGIVALVLYHGFGRIHVRQVVASLRSIPGKSVGLALVLTCASYWLLGFYDVLALRYARKTVPYRRALFTAFDVATVSGFCSLTSMLGLAALAGVSLLLEPNATAVALHFRHWESLLIGTAL